MVTPVEIVNGTLNVIVEEIKDSIFTVILSLATLVLAIITGVSLWKTHHNTRKSIEMTRTEFRHKTRPILARHIHRKKIHNTNDMRQFDGDTYTFISEKIIFHFINNGSTSAINVRKESYLEIKKNGFQNPTLNPYSETKSKRLVDMAPSEYYSIDVEWSSQYYAEAINGKSCYFGLLIWYDDDEKNQYYYHMEGHFEQTMLMLDYVRTGTLKENP